MANLSLASLLWISLSLINAAVALALVPSLAKRGGDVAVENKWLPHEHIKAFQQAPDEGEGVPDIELRFAPLIYSYSGCLPYAAVDVDGNHGAGLSPGGKSGGQCREFDLPGQVYSRMGTTQGRLGIIYSYYLPKIQTKDEDHKHYYLTVVVWVKQTGTGCEPSDYGVAGVSYYKGGGVYNTDSTNTLFAADKSGAVTTFATHPIVAYDGGLDVFPADAGVTGALSPPLIGWTALSDKAREQFNGIVYEHIICPFNDANYQATLDAAYNEAFYKDVPADPGCGATDPTVDPTAPTDPVDPVDPVDPTDPVDPVDPVDPTDPTPTTPAVPTGTMAPSIDDPMFDPNDENSFDDDVGPKDASETGLPDGYIPPEKADGIPDRK